MARNRVKAIFDLEDRLSGKLSKIATSSRRFRDDAKKNGEATKSWSTKIEDFGKKTHKWFGEKTKSLVRGWFMSLKVSAAIGVAALTAVAASAFKSYVEMERTLRNTTGLLAGAGMPTAQIEKQYKQFEEDIQRLAPELAKKPQDLANSLYDIVSGGFEGTDATKVLESATKGASAGMADTATVANALVKTLSAYGDGADMAATRTDQMFQAVNLGIISFDEMAQQIGDVVGLASAAKVSFGDLMSAVIVMTRKGLVPAEAFTSLNQVMLSILSPGTAGIEAAAEAFGKKAEDIWSAKGLAKRGLAGTMAEVMKILQPSDEQLKNLKSTNAQVSELAAANIAGDKMDVLTQLFGNVRALRGAMVLASDTGYTFSDAQKDMQGSMGATDKVMGEQRKTIGFQIDRFKSMFEVMKLQVMDDIAPAIGKQMTKLSGWFKEITDSTEYKNAKGIDKLKIIGRKVWESVSGWWEDNKTKVSKKISEGIDWMAGTAGPAVVEWGAKIGGQLVPAIWKGLVATSPGRMVIAAVAASWANKLGTGMGPTLANKALGSAGGTGGAGGTGAAGGVARTGLMSGGLLPTALAITGAAITINEARVAYNRVANEFGEGSGEVKTTARTATEKGIEAGYKADENAPWWQSMSESILSTVTGKDTSRETLDKAKKANTQLKTGQTIRTYQENGILPALQKLWDDPSRAEELLSKKDAKSFNSDKLMTSALRTGQAGDFASTFKQYSQDPSKLNAGQRSAVEFLIRNSKDTIDNINDSANALYGQGYSQETFSRALEISNPLLEGLGTKTQEWALRLNKAIADNDRAVAMLIVGGSVKSFFSGLEARSAGETLPDNPMGGGKKALDKDTAAAADALSMGLFGKKATTNSVSIGQVNMKDQGLTVEELADQLATMLTAHLSNS